MRLLPCLAALLFAVPALAQDTPPFQSARPAQPRPTIVVEPVGMMIAAFDSDADLRVSRAEFDAGVRRAFDNADPARTGTIGYIGYSDWSERWLGDRNTLPSPFELDRNGDNRISFDEFAVRFDLFFRRFDLDKDGAIARRELVQVHTPQMQGPRGGRGRRRD